MAIAALELPLINPVRFVPQEGELPADPRNNMVGFDADWFKNYVRDWQTSAEYIQPWQYNDYVSVYVNANTTKGITIELIDCHGRVYATWTQTNYYIVSTNVIKVGTTTVAANAYYKRLVFDSGTVPEGIYWLHLTVAYDLNGDNTIDYYRHNISEPISIATTHYGTGHLDYYHTSNAQDVLFIQARSKFMMRLHAEVVDRVTVSKLTQWENGSNNAEVLAGNAYRTAKFALTKRVPEWVQDKLERAWNCNRVSYDSEQLTREIGAAMEIGRIARYPKITATLAVREADHRQGARQIVATSVEVFTVPAYPFVIYSLSLTNVVGSELYYNNLPLIINDATELGNFITAFNIFKADEDLSGTLSNVSGVITWTNVGADTIISGDASLLTNPLSITLSSTNVAEAIEVYGADVFIDFGDGHTEQVGGAGWNSSTQYIYAGSGTQDINIFGSYTGIRFNDGNITAVTGGVPVGMTVFSLPNTSGLTTFDATVLTNADPTLTRWDMFDNVALASVSNFGSLDLPVINRMFWNGNNFDTTDVNSILTAMYTKVDATATPGPANNSGYLYLQDQQTPAPPSGAGATAATNLLDDYYWNVTTD